MRPLLAAALCAVSSLACGSTVYSPGLPDSGSSATPGGGGSTPDASSTSNTVVDSPPKPGRDCVGAMCPIPLLGVIKNTNGIELSPTAVAIDGTNVLIAGQFYDDCYVGRVPKLGGNLERVYAASGGRCRDMVARSSTVYLPFGFDSTTLLSVPTAGGSATTIMGGDGAAALAVDTSLYFSVYGGDIRKLSLSGGTAQTVQSSRPLSRLAVSGNDLFWVEENASSYRLARATTSPGTVTYVATGLTPLTSLATNGTHLFWAELSSPTCKITRMPLQGGSMTVMNLPCPSLGICVNPTGGDSTCGRPMYSSIAADSTDLVITAPGGLYRINL